jgi:hypothetical protein
VDGSGSTLRLRFSEETPLGPEVLVAALHRLPGSALHPEGIKVPLVPGQAPMDALDEALAAIEQSAKGAL